MSQLRSWRAALSYGVGALLAFQGLGVILPSQTHAASQTLRISEIDWAGSPTNPDDQWLELTNTDANTIDFTVTPYTVEIPSLSEVITLDTGKLDSGQYLVVHKKSFANSTLQKLAGVKYRHLTSLELPTTAADYLVKDETSTVIDQITDTGSGLPFAGTCTTMTGCVSTMSRIDLDASGSTPTNWYTAHTTGRGFDMPSDPLQFGTPGTLNQELAVPTGDIMPAGSTTLSNPPVVSGTATAPANHLTIDATRVSSGPAFSQEYQVPLVGGHTYTGTLTGLEAGRYLIDVYARDALGDRSEPLHVLNMVGGTDFNYEVLPDTSTVPTPVITDPATPTVLTNQPEITLKGTLDAGTTYSSLEYLLNGVYYTTQTVSGTTFTSPSIILKKDAVNTIQVVGVTNLGEYSLPATVTVTNDSKAPNPVDLTKVTVNSNPPGTHDSFVGMPGAAEANTTLFVYGDTAETQLLATLAVAADGSFPLVDIGDNQHDKVYLVLQDAAGNRSAQAVVSNPIDFSTGSHNLSPHVIDLGETSAFLGWNKVDAAVRYRVKYKQVGGAYSAPTDMCLTGNTNCSFTTTIANLASDTDYVFAVAAVDKFGNESTYEEVNFHTKTTPVPPIVATIEKITPKAKAAAASTAPKATDVITTPTPSPTATPESGDVKSETTTARNWTPWIVLGVLVAIAVLATAGYFYWFGGEAGEAALASVMAERAKREEEEADKPKSKPQPKKGSGKDRRW